MGINNKITSRGLALLTVVLCPQAWATTPAEMAAMSLQDLLNMQTGTDFSSGNGDNSAETERWRFGLLYSQSRFEGYQNGTDKLNDEEVLFRQGTEARTQENYPILPTIIRQEAFTVTASYRFEDGASVDLNIPLISQTTHHDSVVPGYAHFTIDSRGLGDISVNYSRYLSRDAYSKLRFGFGLSAPTGSIDQKGDTPRAAGDQQLPYTMQLGSGTWDLPISINYTRALKSSWTVGGSALAKIRLGRNDRDYRLGNRLQLASWIQSTHYDWVEPFAKISAVYWEDINGRDDEIIVQPAAPFVYPASITNPDNFGGKKIRLSIGVEFAAAFRLELGVPLYQDLNGVQVRETVNLSASWQKSI